MKHLAGVEVGSNRSKFSYLLDDPEFQSFLRSQINLAINRLLPPTLVKGAIPINDAPDGLIHDVGGFGSDSQIGNRGGFNSFPGGMNHKKPVDARLSMPATKKGGSCGGHDRSIVVTDDFEINILDDVVKEDAIVSVASQ